MPFVFIFSTEEKVLPPANLFLRSIYSKLSIQKSPDCKKRLKAVFFDKQHQAAYKNHSAGLTALFLQTFPLSDYSNKNKHPVFILAVSFF